jgi:polyphenol oxidase
MVSSGERGSRFQAFDRVLDEGGLKHARRLPSTSGSASGSALRPAKSNFTALQAIQKDGSGNAKRGSTLEVIRVPEWSGPEWGWLVHGFSTRPGGGTKIYRPESKGRNGDLNLGFTASDMRETVMMNRQLFLRAVRGRGPELNLATLAQFHSTLIWDIESGVTALDPVGGTPPAVLKGDGLITDAPGILLGIQTADCLPILMADRKNRVVAALHAGWRGTLGRIAEKGVGRMRLQFGSKPQDIVAAIGPGIGQCCYAVGEEIKRQFESQFAYAAELFCEVSDADEIRRKYPMLFLTARAPGHSDLGPQIHLDLAEANRRQLLAAGLAPDGIYLTRECTACQTKRFFSHRAEHGFTGRMMSVIGICPLKG